MLLLSDAGRRYASYQNIFPEVVAEVCVLSIVIKKNQSDGPTIPIRLMSSTIQEVCLALNWHGVPKTRIVEPQFFAKTFQHVRLFANETTMCATLSCQHGVECETRILSNPFAPNELTVSALSKLFLAKMCCSALSCNTW